MARIDGEILIGRPVDVVFDFVADQRNETQYNPRMVRAARDPVRPSPGMSWLVTDFQHGTWTKRT
jgi:hypothetical protein